MISLVQYWNESLICEELSNEIEMGMWSKLPVRNDKYERT